MISIFTETLHVWLVSIMRACSLVTFIGSLQTQDFLNMEFALNMECGDY